MPKKLPRKGITREGENATIAVDPIEIFGYGGELQPAVNAMICRAAAGNTELQSTLQEILDYLGRMSLTLYGAPQEPGTFAPSAEAVPIAPIEFQYNLTRDNVILYWTPGSADFTYFEIRKGTNWDTGDRIIITNNLTALLDPVLIGRHDYMIRAMGKSGTYSSGILSTGFNIPPLGAIVITASVTLNSVQLSWTVPTSTWRLAYFTVKRQGITVATTTGTFYAGSEQAAGNYTYSVVAVDIAGNSSLPAEVTIYTTGVADYVLYSTKNWDPSIATIVNGRWDKGLVTSGTDQYLDDKIWYCIINETYQQHFTSRSWASPQAQVNAGYNAWLSPFATTGSYEQVFDFGAVINNVILTIGWNYDLTYGNFTIGVESRISTDNISYSAPNTTTSYFVTTLRYVKVKINLTAQNDKSLMALKNVTVKLNVKRENDGGQGMAYASDASGTVVTFNKIVENPPAFLDVEAITVTPESDKSFFATYIFADVPYPRTFAVKIFDNAGVRITCPFRWNARGIV